MLPYERKRIKPLVTLWLTNVTNHNVIKVLPQPFDFYKVEHFTFHHFPMQNF